MVLFLQEVAQVGAVAVDRISDDPADRQARRLDVLHHPLGQFGFGREGERVWNVGRASARQISAPVFGHIQVAIDEGMAPGRHVGEKDAQLAVLDLAGHPAILRPDACRVAAAFGKAAFIQHEDRER